MRVRVYDVCVYESVNLGGADTYVQMHKCSCARDTFIWIQIWDHQSHVHPNSNIVIEWNKRTTSRLGIMVA